MNTDAYQKLIDVIHNAAISITDSKEKYASVLEKIGDARFVLMGEASHGTQEFYQTRIELTKRLIEEKRFMAVMIEGDWPDAYRVHRYLQGHGDANQSETALEDFKRFPTWMWRNTMLPPFLKWLRAYTKQLSAEADRFCGGLKVPLPAKAFLNRL